MDTVAPSQSGGYCCMALVAVPREIVKEECRQWAKDLRWFPVELGEDAPLRFKLTRFNWIIDSPELEVRTYSTGGATEVRFCSDIVRWYPGASHEVARAVDAFANGVSHELALRGATVEPHSIAEYQQNRARLATTSRVIVPTYWALLAAALPVGAIVGLASAHATWGVIAGAWLIVAMLAIAVVRYRTAGMKARFVIGLIMPILLIVSVFTLIIAAE
jgi:hypothetical protein